MSSEGSSEFGFGLPLRSFSPYGPSEPVLPEIRDVITHTCAINWRRFLTERWTAQIFAVSSVLGSAEAERRQASHVLRSVGTTVLPSS